MKLKTLGQFESKDPCECGGNCGCGKKSVNERFSFSKKEVESAASLIASAIAQADKVKTKVHHLEYDKGRGAGFDISIDGEESAGGSYVVKDNGDVVNAAIGNLHPNAVYNTIGNKDIADVFINMERYESVVTEAKEEPIVALLKLGLFAAKGTGEKKLLKLSDDFEEIGDEQADEIASHLNMAIELFQDGYSKDAVSHFKKFNKACKDELALMKKQGLAESEVNEAKEMSKKEVRDLKIKINNARTIGKYFTKDEVEFLQSLFESEVNEAKKYKFKELAKAWEFVYGEEMEDEYEGFYQEVVGKYKNKVTKADIATIWSNVYGEEIDVEYSGFYTELKENLEQLAKLELLEANSDGTISDDEDERMEDLLGTVEAEIDDLISKARDGAYDIGGNFRGPGNASQLKKLMLDKIKKMKH